MNDPVRVELKDFYLSAFEEFPTVSLLLAYEQAIANVRQKKVIKNILPCSNPFLMNYFTEVQRTSTNSMFTKICISNSQFRSEISDSRCSEVQFTGNDK
jgi:hypothetical protein